MKILDEYEEHNGAQTEGVEEPGPSRRTLANRKNAQKSTGPKTEEGKEAIKNNARTHGIFAKTILLDGDVGKEDAEEYDQYLDDLYEQYPPQNGCQRRFIEGIAIKYWQLLRTNQYAQVLRKSRESSVRYDLVKKEAERIWSLLEQLPKKEARKELMNSYEGVQKMLDILLDAQEKFSGPETLSDDRMTLVAHILGEDRFEWMLSLCKYAAEGDMEEDDASALGQSGTSRKTRAEIFVNILMGKTPLSESKIDDPANPVLAPGDEKPPTPPEPTAPHSSINRDLFDKIDEAQIGTERALKTKIRNLRKRLSKLEKKEIRLSYPDMIWCQMLEDGELEKISRYQTTIERSIERDITRLEKMQSSRRGDAA